MFGRTNPWSLIGFVIASGPVEQFESRISSKLIVNSESWIGLNQTHIDRLQKVQDDFFITMFQVSKMGTMNCMIQLDSQTLKMKWQIIQRKIRQVRKTMSKQSTNLCRQALIEGPSTSGGEYLLTECIEWFKKFETDT